MRYKNTLVFSFEVRYSRVDRENKMCTWEFRLTGDLYTT